MDMNDRMDGSVPFWIFIGAIAVIGLGVLGITAGLL